jgi:hypothetical protein
MPPVFFTSHARDRMARRGTSEAEVEEVVRTGEHLEARHGRLAFRKDFAYGREWEGKWYDMKQVMPIVAEEQDKLVIVTVYVFYIGEQS